MEQQWHARDEKYFPMKKHPLIAFAFLACFPIFAAGPVSVTNPPPYVSTIGGIQTIGGSVGQIPMIGSDSVLHWSNAPSGSVGTQTPWVTSIDGAGNSLAHAGTIQAGQGGFAGIIVTNGITNLSITANSMVKLDSNQNMTAATAGSDFVSPATTITIAGTANQITSSAGAQDLSANRTVTLSLPSQLTLPGSLTIPAASLNPGAASFALGVTSSGQVTTNSVPGGGGSSPTTAAQNFIASNNVVDGQKDVTNIFSVAGSSFVDGVTFRKRFGTNTSLMCRPLGGGVANRLNYTADDFGITLTNGMTLQLPTAISNVTVVALVRNKHYWEAASGAQIWSLGNTNTHSGIVGANTAAGFNSYWTIQETFRSQQWAGANNGSLSNRFSPLWGSRYDSSAPGDWAGDPLFVAWQRDQAGNWRMYVDTVQGEIGVTSPTLVWQSPTNATDALTNFGIGFDVATNSNPQMATLTNLDISSIFIFSDTNYSSVIAGYQAAVLASPYDKAEFMFGDSRLDLTGTLVHKPSQYYSRGKNNVFLADQSQSGLQAFTFNAAFLSSGALPEITNLPRAKISDVTVTYALGINDIYVSGATPTQLFGYWTNAIDQFAAGGANVRFCDIYQVATNASAVAYSLANETNAWTASMMIRTNENVPISVYVPIRGALTQALINTNGPFSVDGLHMAGRTNALLQQFVADLIAHPVDRVLTNGPIGP
jgi:hypothetical protein